MSGVGSSGTPFKLSKSNRNYTTRYFKATHSSGDIRVNYDYMKWTSTGGGEVSRLYAVTAGTGVATGATVNALHATCYAYTGTVSGASNAARFTVSTAASLSPGGTRGAIQIDNDHGSGATVGNCAGIRFTKSGTTDGGFAMAFDDDQYAKGSTATSADGIAIRWHDGTTKYIMIGS